MSLRHCTWAFVLLVASVASAQEAPPPAATGYTIFLRGTPVGREDVTVKADASGLLITSQGRMSVPASVTTRRAEIKYLPDWSPESFVLEATQNGGEITARSTFTDTVARTDGMQGGTPYSREHPISPKSFVLLPNSFFGAFEAITRRFADVEPGTSFSVYIVPQGGTSVKLASVTTERMQVGSALFDVRRFEVLWQNPGGDLAASLTATMDGSLVRMSIPSQSLDVVRADVAASTSRTQVYSNPGDQAATIPATGFNLGATLTRPEGNTPARLPAVILLAGSGIGDRDGTASGVPTLAQLAGSLARAGYIAVRYDKRGFGQSGGRAESATIADYAEDVRSVVKWLDKRDDVDRKRIAVLGHGEGAWVALLAAAKEKKIAAVISVAGAGSTGADLILEQQQRTLDGGTLSPEDREARVVLQKQIHSATITGRGWDGVPADLRKQADTPWFQSFLLFDPAETIEDVRQPLLFVHGAVDRQVPVANAERLVELARTESKSKSVELVVVRGVNHLLVPAVTGDVAEYASLADKNVSKDLTEAINAWLAKTFAAVR